MAVKTCIRSNFPQTGFNQSRLERSIWVFMHPCIWFDMNATRLVLISLSQFQLPLYLMGVARLRTTIWLFCTFTLKAVNLRDGWIEHRFVSVYLGHFTSSVISLWLPMFLCFHCCNSTRGMFVAEKLVMNCRKFMTTWRLFVPTCILLEVSTMKRQDIQRPKHWLLVNLSWDYAMAIRFDFLLSLLLFYALSYRIALCRF